MNSKKDARGYRADLYIYDDLNIGIDKEEFSKIIEAFVKIPERYTVPHDELLYVSSAWKENKE